MSPIMFLFISAVSTAVAVALNVLGLRDDVEEWSDRFGPVAAFGLIATAWAIGAALLGAWLIATGDIK